MAVMYHHLLGFAACLATVLAIEGLVALGRWRFRREERREYSGLERRVEGTNSRFANR
ncbi:MAG: hypothetical protein Q8K78_19050 [Planctomycetaceae bacterium]|nr:hypothetical protein [Planctomycetaceae bacterium]